MLQKNIFLLLLLGSLSAFSQELANSIPLQLKKDKGVFQVVDETAKKTTLFFADKTQIKTIRLDGAMKMIDSMSTARPDKAYDIMVGYSTSGEQTRVFWSSSDHEEVYAQVYDFEKKGVGGEKYLFPFKEDRFLQVFSEKDKFYILSIIRKTNKLKLYVFGSDGKMQEKIIDFSNAKFFDYYYHPISLYEAFGESFMPAEPAYSLQQIHAEDLTSLTESSKKRKCYLDGGKIYITFDGSTDFTHLITLDLTNFTGVEKVVQKPYIAFNDRYELNSNSFVIDGQLYQIKTSSSKMFFVVKDLQGNVLKEYSKTPDDQLDFKNSEIIQESGDPENPRILEKTSQFLRKTNNQNSGMAISKNGDNYLVTMGSVSDERASTGMMVGGMFGVAGALVAIALTNPTFDSFNSYSNRKVVYINCLFDKSGNHVDGALKPLAFDKIRKFTKDRKDLASPTLFRFEDAYYFGYYSKADKNYLLTKFNN